MEENRFTEENNESSAWHGGPWLITVAFLFLLAAGGILIYNNAQQRALVGQLSNQTVEMNRAISHLQTQLDAANAKLSEVSVAQQAAQAASVNSANNAPRAAAVSRADANRLRQLQQGLADQKKQLQATRDDVAKTRSDLEGNLSSTRDELNGSIAKTHDELVLLEKRGERDYFEFDASKSKQFKRTGPLSISLRRTDAKHDNSDLVVLVNDRQIGKRVNLYEPVWIYESKDAQPFQIVVNKIDKNNVHGYISAPKYSTQELAAAPTYAPVSQTTPVTSTDELQKQ